MKTKNYCFIGYGSICKKHINIIKSLNKRAKIIVLKNLNKNITIKNGEVNFLSLEEIKTIEIDSVFITNPSSMHYRWLKKIFKLNVNIFIEKPVFDKYHNINKIIEYQRNIQKKIRVGYIFRYDPLLIYLKKLVDNITIGELKIIKVYCGSNLKGWRANSKLKDSISLKKELGGGVLRELSHEIDYLLWIFGDFKISKSELSNSGSFKESNVFDKADILFEKASSDLLAVMHLNFYQKESERYCIIVGNDGIIKADLLNRKITLEKNGKKNIKKFCSIDEVYKKQIVNFLKPSINEENYQQINEAIKVVKYINMIENKNFTKKL